MITCIQPYKTVMLLFLFNSVVVNILQKDMFPQDVDTEIRRGCYAICLQLARFVFFWILELTLSYMLWCNFVEKFSN